MTAPRFKPGRNIALKIPAHQFEETLRFYRDIIGLPTSESASGSVAVSFGYKTLWLDPVSTLSQAEIWLELAADDPDEAARFLAERGVVRRDEIEPLPQGFEGFWITNAAGIIHLVCKEGP